MRPIILALLAGAAQAAGQTTIDRADYADRLRAMWLGGGIANWTGLRTEGYRIEPPFLTDADWNTTPPGRLPITFVLDQDPWRADDDTDVEYVSLHLMSQRSRCLLAGPEISAGWILHMDPAWIWVSNHQAWELMNRGVTPPATGSPVANPFWGFIDAQLTTEFFGALCPGMPDATLKYADLPIRTTAAGFAAHAAQFYALLYAYALQAPPGLSGRDRALWLVDHARPWLPDSSKAADIVDFVRADFVANPDVNDWELTRDRIASRYMLNAPANGFHFYNWTESSVNFACGILCLLYGQCDFRRTVQIGTLSGWDSDNCTATMGGLLGLILGYNQLTAQFPGQVGGFSDRYTIEPTRNNLPDYLPADPQAEDTLTLMAQRMLPLIDANVLAAGGSVDTVNNRWILPPAPAGPPLERNPLQAAQRRSANGTILAAGGQITRTSSAAGSPPGVPWINGVGDPSFFANGFEADNSGRDLLENGKFFYSTQGSGQPPGTVQTLTVEYDRPVQVGAVRFMEGDHFGPPLAQQGGWFQSLTVELKVSGQWVASNATPSEPLDPLVPFQIIDFTLPAPMTATGIRISGPSSNAPGNPEGFITCAELDAIAPPDPYCYPNCDGSTTSPILNVLDFSCFLNRFAAGDPRANCDGSTNPPVLNVLDFSCFLNSFASGCP